MVEAPADSALLPDGAALSAYQYFENLRNFLVSMEELGLPTFEASDLEGVRIFCLFDKLFSVSFFLSFKL